MLIELWIASPILFADSWSLTTIMLSSFSNTWLFLILHVMLTYKPSPPTLISCFHASLLPWYIASMMNALVCSFPFFFVVRLDFSLFHCALLASRAPRLQVGWAQAAPPLGNSTICRRATGVSSQSRSKINKRNCDREGRRKIAKFSFATERFRSFRNKGNQCFVIVHFRVFRVDCVRGQLAVQKWTSTDQKYKVLINPWLDISIYLTSTNLSSPACLESPLPVTLCHHTTDHLRRSQRVLSKPEKPLVMMSEKAAFFLFRILLTLATAFPSEQG